ncbi:MAG: kynureninase [Bacteroidetes bacterium]|nr:kynureninase [Bacteroidota bacterium]
MSQEFSIEYALALDAADPLKAFRDEFYFPKHKGKDVIYFTGNSLGLQPKSVASYIQQELDDWANLGVEGHFHAKHPWMPYHEFFTKQLAELVGAKETEVVAMNQLTVNIHLLLASFYRPTKERYKIICEAKAFPSDQYALETQVRHHGLNPEDAIIEVHPREGEYLIREEDIIQTIQQHEDSLALVFWGGVNYYSGQLFDMQSITQAAHAAGAYAGFDLAHAAGNVRLQLHDWNADFATWCSYKYLNSGPGGVSGVYIHEKYATNIDMPRLAGWWGHDKQTRFLMEKGFRPIPSAEGWQLSNAPVLSMAAHKASLNIFEKAGWEQLHAKREKLSAYLHLVMSEVNRSFTEPVLKVITPDDPTKRGCQLSMLMLKDGKKIFNALTEQGVIADWREPNVIRIAPVPLYNSFEDVFRFGKICRDALLRVSK